MEGPNIIFEVQPIFRRCQRARAKIFVIGLKGGEQHNHDWQRDSMAPRIRERYLKTAPKKDFNLLIFNAPPEQPSVG